MHEEPCPLSLIDVKLREQLPSAPLNNVSQGGAFLFYGRIIPKKIRGEIIGFTSISTFYKRRR
jgi:hypothetical protein